MKNFISFVLPPIVWMAVIFTLSSMPQSRFPVIPIPHIDKVVHICIFFILALLIDRSVRHQTIVPSLQRHHFLLTVAVVVLYGMSDEFHQIYVPTRSPDIADLVADSIGGLLYVLFHSVRTLRAKRNPVP